MRRRVALAVALGALAVATAATGQELVGGSAIDILTGSASKGPVRLTSARVTLSGSLTVDFHSDPATCAALGRCGLEGTVVWRAPRRGQLVVLQRKSGRPLDAYFAGDPRDGFLTGRLLTTAQVRRSDAAGQGLCSDGNPDSSSLEVEGSGGDLVFALRGGNDAADLLATRCPGPLLGDVAGGLVTRRVSLATLRHGATNIDFSGQSPFTAAGLTGTARSDVVMTVGRARTERDTAPRPPRGTHPPRHRVLEVAYRIARATGSVRFDLRGDRDTAACAPLDACGLAGTQVVTPRAVTGSGDFFAFATSSRATGRALRAALGLAPGGRGAGIDVFGTALWSDRGRDEVSIGRSGETPCTDRRPLRDGYLTLAVEGKDVHAAYYAGVGATLHTRCPGPKPEGTLASATVPLRAFAHRRVTLHVRGRRPLTAEGYAGTVKADLVVVLTRKAVRERVLAGLG